MRQITPVAPNQAETGLPVRESGLGDIAAANEAAGADAVGKAIVRPG